MAVQRLFPDVERTRRTAGWLFGALGLLATVGLAWLAIERGRVTATTVVLLALSAALAVWGLRLALRLPVVLEVDLERRTYAVLRDGARSGSGGLDELGPLTVSRRSRVVRTGASGRRTVTEYVVSSAAQADIDLFVRHTPGRARQEMERLGRRWQLPCQSFGGEVRRPEDLDKPLHERIRIARQALAATPLRPEWGLRVEPLWPGYALVSSHRSWAPLVQGALLLLPVAFVVAVVSRTGLRWNTPGDLLDQVFAGLLGLVVVVLFGRLALGVRDTFFPGTVRVTERGVSYRGRRLSFDQIEEVTTSHPIEIFGDRRILSLAVSFCPPEATPAVAFELQRLILEVAQNGPSVG